MRRRPNTLLPIEVALLQCAADLLRRGEPDFHGYGIARELRDAEGARQLTGHGTLYRALDRLQKAGLLKSQWEHPAVAAAEERPRRRLYRITAAGEQALQAAPVASPAPNRKFGEAAT